jgi:hypothetical protein
MHTCIHYYQRKNAACKQFEKMYAGMYRVYICIDACMYMYVCVCMYTIYACMNIFTHIYSKTETQEEGAELSYLEEDQELDLSLYISMHSYMYTCIIYIYIYIYICTHTCIQKKRQEEEAELAYLEDDQQLDMSLVY